MGAEAAGALADAGLSFGELVEVLRREERMRLSEETQAAYARAEASGTDWLAVTQRLQQRLLSEAGVEPSRMAAGLHVLRSASSYFGKATLAAHGALPLYVRHNRSDAGQLREGDALPAGLTLHTLDGAAVDARSVLGGQSVPTLLLAGSWT